MTVFYDLKVTKKDGTVTSSQMPLKDAKDALKALKNDLEVVSAQIVKPEWVYGSYQFVSGLVTVRSILPVPH